MVRSAMPTLYLLRLWRSWQRVLRGWRAPASPFAPEVPEAVAGAEPADAVADGAADAVARAPADANPAVGVAATVPEPAPEAGAQADAVPALDAATQAAFLGWLFGLGAPDAGDALTLPEPDISLLELSYLNRLEQERDQLANDRRAIPRPPAVLPKLMAVLRDDGAGAIDIARLVAKDAALVGEVLNRANSAWYRRGPRIPTLERAVVLLGRDGMSQLIAAAAMRPLLDLRSGRLSAVVAPRLWDVSCQRAAAAAMLAHARRMEVFDAYLAGLLVDIGLSAAIRFVDRLLGARPLPRSVAFYRALWAQGLLLCAQVLGHWNLPQPVVVAIAEQDGERPDAACSPLGRLLREADAATRAQLAAAKVVERA